MPRYETAIEQLAHAPLPVGLHPTEDERAHIVAYWREQQKERPGFVEVLEIYRKACSQDLPAETCEQLRMHVWYVLCVLYEFMRTATRRPELANWWKYNPVKHAQLWLRYADALGMTTDQLQTQVMRRWRELGA